MKYWVLDKNVLENKASLESLLADRENRGVLFENTFHEMRAKDPNNNLQLSLRFLGQYADQIVLAHHPNRIEEITQETRQFTTTDLIDLDASKNLSGLFKHIQTGRIFDDPRFQEVAEGSENTLLVWSQSAKQVIEYLSKEDFAFFHEYGHRLFIKKSSLLDCWHPISHKAWMWFDQIRRLSMQPLVGPTVIRQMLSFRILLFQVLYFCWIRRSEGPIPENTHRIANDLTDMTYCALATYFDGLLSHETMVNNVFPVGKAFLDKLCNQPSLEMKS